VTRGTVGIQRLVAHGALLPDSEQATTSPGFSCRLKYHFQDCRNHNKLDNKGHTGMHLYFITGGLFRLGGLGCWYGLQLYVMLCYRQVCLHMPHFLPAFKPPSHYTASVGTCLFLTQLVSNSFLYIHYGTSMLLLPLPYTRRRAGVPSAPTVKKKLWLQQCLQTAVCRAVFRLLLKDMTSGAIGGKPDF
jgi:hypothetical protein